MTEHTFRPRVSYPYGHPGPVELDACGFILDPMLNATCFDPVYCNKTRRDHEDSALGAREAGR